MILAPILKSFKRMVSKVALARLVPGNTLARKL